MALWIIQKIRQPLPSEPVADCLGDQIPVEVTLKDTDTGEYQVLQICFNPSVLPCDSGGLLYNLNAGGYTPADWDTECGFGG